MAVDFGLMLTACQTDGSSQGGRGRPLSVSLNQQGISENEPVLLRRDFFGWRMPSFSHSTCSRCQQIKGYMLWFKLCVNAPPHTHTHMRTNTQTHTHEGCSGGGFVTEKLRSTGDLTELVVLAQLSYKIQMTKLVFLYLLLHITTQHIRAFQPFTPG